MVSPFFGPYLVYFSFYVANLEGLARFRQTELFWARVFTVSAQFFGDYGETFTGCICPFQKIGIVPAHMQWGN